MQVSVVEAKKRLPQLIASAQAGEEVIIANHGKPVAKLVAIREKQGVTDGVGSGLAILDWLGRHPLRDHSRRSADEIDAAIEAERASWD
jgi:prevent-host-death family protein